MKSTENNWHDQYSSPDQVMAILGAGFKESEVALIGKALDFLWSLPDKGSDYLPDPVSVAVRLKNLNVDAECVIASILGSHICADHMPVEAVHEQFGENIGRLVGNVRWLNSLIVARHEQTSDSTFASQQTELLRRMVLSMVDDVRAVLIRLVFRAQRMPLLKKLDEKERLRMARETLDLYAPLANRLGVGQLKWEMEDLAFRIIEPASYKRVATALEERREDREAYIRNFVAVLSDKLRQEKITTATVKGRPKHIYSIWSKMKRKRLEFSDLFDVRAVRVLVDSIQECYAVLGVVHSSWKHIPREFDDYIANPKENGYQSLHTAVYGPDGKAVEVQIRTRQMDDDAELGVAAHWLYKEGGPQDERLQRNINSLRQLLENQDEDSFLESVASEVFNDRVFVFTPAGDVVDLPAGATPLDFAYQVHTEIGHRCRGAKINGRIVPLGQPLENGDQVEILTSRDAAPRRDWLNKELGFLASGRSRAKVRAWFNQQDQEQHKTDGKLIVERELKRMRAGTISHENLMQQLHFDNMDKFYVAVGRNDISLPQLAGAVSFLEDQQRGETRQLRSRQVHGPAEAGDKSDIRVSGVGHLLTQIASCCKPVPYDSIVGFITRGKGVSVHRKDCKNILNLNAEDQLRLIDVDWGAESDQAYAVDIWILAYDRQGLLRDVTAILSNEKISVTSVHTQSDAEEQTAEMRLTIEVENLEQLARVMEKLRQLRNILEVERMA
ncbi:MAG: bifunctional (p)ppGpp synthetase/guanosine-3',5'-bis(diphosphate) 3'-pyrophosphohydrolase [Gammaproteobacteria bacterium]|nr:bifunctional (p)ppGpp synthetase/guanosine-3',5'-bis(diphosphate) 3'-pyrophosphohydrolase [Gammaproteobacteria bacterium]